jgi:5-methyltetrahydropteroyltriglutamate--homocysteine methyltransferase
MTENTKTYAYGFPTIGPDRSFKFLVEGFWSGEVSEEELRKGLLSLERGRLQAYADSVDAFPIGELSFYNKMLDTALMVGVYEAEGLQDYYQFCRGKGALPLTKWFNTNYHYLVPHIDRVHFKKNAYWKDRGPPISHTKGIPYLIGPFTFLKLSRLKEGIGFADALMVLAQVYKELLDDAQKVHMDEPALVLDLSKEEMRLFREVYQELGRGKKIHLFTYYGPVDDLSLLYDLPLASIGLDLVHGRRNIGTLERKGFPSDKALMAGLVSGKSPWKTHFNSVLPLLERIKKKAQKVVISNASPLYHLPITLRGDGLPSPLTGRLAFAQEKLKEISLLARVLQGEGSEDKEQGSATYGINQEVREKVEKARVNFSHRTPSYSERRNIQSRHLNLPLFPTTAIGSFPQTSDVRAKRKAYRVGEIKREDYETFIKEKIREAIRIQEEAGLDVLAHGEFERSDMVEFFAERLDGIATTSNGWVLSYGTRCYRPPIIYGDVSRSGPLTLNEIPYAQSLTKKPVKGMLTGPVTILAWSFVREDIPEEDVAYQIALALGDEVREYGKSGIKVIQIDEPAFREKAPLKKRDWEDYFSWAVRAYNLIISQTKPETQVHLHMCYSRFENIIEYLEEMDFDVISIEASRSKGEILKAFEARGFDRGIGLGVWDVHSEVVPEVDDMVAMVERALKVIDPTNLWINPDCGLKTRAWKEVVPGLRNMVEAATRLRRSHGHI